jgi:hypothetical protein
MSRDQRQQQYAVTGLLCEPTESLYKCAKMGADMGILYSQDQWVCFKWKRQIADRPAGASGDSNNTRFGGRDFSSREQLCFYNLTDIRILVNRKKFDFHAART